MNELFWGSLYFLGYRAEVLGYITLWMKSVGVGIEFSEINKWRGCDIWTRWCVRVR